MESVTRVSVTGVFVFFLATLILWLYSVFFEISFNKRKDLLWIIAGACFYQATNLLIRLRVSRDPLFLNTSVSLSHSLITSISVILILWNQYMKIGLRKMIEHSELVEEPWEGAFPAVSFSCGYFAYDQLDMLLKTLYRGTFPFILIHHLILLVCFTLALYRNVTINYLTLTLICEMHSIFLHVRKLRRMAGFRDGNGYMVKVEWVINWITFVFTRFVPHVLIFIKLIRDSSMFEDDVELWLALMGMVGMNTLNILLGVDLLQAYKRERLTSRKAKK